jgi:hypothetical protein
MEEVGCGIPAPMEETAESTTYPACCRFVNANKECHDAGACSSPFWVYLVVAARQFSAGRRWGLWASRRSTHLGVSRSFRGSLRSVLTKSSLCGMEGFDDVITKGSTRRLTNVEEDMFNAWSEARKDPIGEII